MADSKLVFEMILNELVPMMKRCEKTLRYETDQATGDFLKNRQLLNEYIHTMKKSIIQKIELDGADYGQTIEIFCKHFEDAIIHTTENNKAGFIFLFVRDDEPGNIDIASNLTTDCMKRFLSDAQIMLDDRRNKDWDKTKH